MSATNRPTGRLAAWLEANYAVETRTHLGGVRMGKPILIAIIAALVLAAVLVPRHTVPREQGSTGLTNLWPRWDRGLAMRVNPLSARWKIPQVEPANSSQFVSLGRARTDSDYRAAIRKHEAIQSYFVSPLKDNPELERVLDWLLAHGYGIEDLNMAWSYVNATPAATAEAQALIRNRSRGNPEKLLASVTQQLRRSLANAMNFVEGEEDLIESLLALAPQEPRSSLPARENMPFMQAMEGEILLRDENWMTPERLRIVQEYQGPCRSTDRFVSIALGRDPLPPFVRSDIGDQPHQDGQIR
jgi:hypothetical protein